MDRSEFEARLKAEGFPEIRTNELPANRHHPEHSHPFDVPALVLEGDITLGPAGVKYLVGRRPA
jgi:quercetin dioxygenase-like cupin family protein